MSLTLEYLKLLIKPFLEKIYTFETVEVLHLWAVMTFEALETYQMKNNNILNLQAEIQEWLIKMILDGRDPILITPWDLAAKRNKQVQNWLGPETKEIPIDVIIGPNRYPHRFTQSFLVGLLLSSDNNYFRLALGDQFITRDNKNIWESYTKNNFNRYRLGLKGKNYYFDEPDFIHGLITGYFWLQKDYLPDIDEFGEINQKGEIINFLTF